MRDRYKITQKDRIHFMTSTVIEWLPIFTHEKYFEHWRFNSARNYLGEYSIIQIDPLQV